MSAVIPPQFLFRFAFPVTEVGALPRSKGKRLLNLPETCRLPQPAALEGGGAVGDLRVAWNAHGLGVCVDVAGKAIPPSCDPDRPTSSDGLQVWIDTRNTQNVHRATRFCHTFCLLPAGGGPSGSAPLAVQLPVPRAKEDAPFCKPDAILVASDLRRDGYVLEAWFPAAVLHGFDPESQPRLGFYYVLRDSERGDQFLTVGTEFPFDTDPSLWATLELTGTTAPPT